MDNTQPARYCQVALRDAGLAFDRPYTYSIPAQLAGQISLGSYVEVPFGKANRLERAFVTACPVQADQSLQIKPLARLLAPRPVLRPDQIRLAASMCSQLVCTLGSALSCMVPAAVAARQDRSVKMAELKDPAEASRRLAGGEISRLGQLRVVELLLECEMAPVQEIMDACQVSRSVLNTLAKNDWLVFFDRRQPPPPAAEADYELVSPWTANPDQAAAIKAICGAVQEPPAASREFLLFGVTGSGKTEVYLQAAKEITSSGKTALILVPEIALTPQMISRIRSRFGPAVALLHSRLTPAQRYAQWQLIWQEKVQVVVGARSAIFAPLREIGLIVIDEEQETTYKSETHPRYHVRDIARLRSAEHGAALVLGSATPAVETYYQTVAGQSQLLSLPSRISRAGLAQTEIVDMRAELNSGNRSIFSRGLQKAMLEAFSKQQQAMIFINRRGFAGFVLCRNCGHIVRCNECSVSLTIHIDQHGLEDKQKTQLICHYCGRIRPQPASCPECGSRQIGRFGAGTQQVEAAFNHEFAPHKALRMDQDTTVGKDAHARILASFEQGEASALIGTQMIAKGHDFANVTVAGVLAADLMLGISDFRAPERAFQLITQAAGRAGRGTEPGRVFIQAYNIDDFAIRHAAAQDYPGFFGQELAYRQKMGYPPFGALCSLTVSSLAEAAAREKCQQIAARCRQIQKEQGLDKVSLLGPAQAPVYRIRKRYRWRILLKSPQREELVLLVGPLQREFAGGEAALAVDFDPYSLL